MRPARHLAAIPVAARLCLWGLGALLAAAPGVADAALGVTPTGITLSAARPTELLNLTNQGEEQARYQVSVFAWKESPAGETQLDPTEEIVAFPPLLTIGPNQSRNIRIGFSLRPGAEERTYRIIVQELPEAPKPGAPVQIKVLTKLSIPVFVAPAAPRLDARIEAPALAQGVLSFAVANTGTAHLQFSKIRVAAKGGQGPSFEVTTPGWYVLPGGRRLYQVNIASADCRGAPQFTIEAEGDAKTVTADFAAPAEGCTGARAAKTGFAPPAERSASR
jgi:fimbrial chaperone protein